MSERWATFDCYGTLIDWDGGVRACLGSLWPGADEGALLARYHDVEPGLQADGTATYRQVLDLALAEVARSEGLTLSIDGADALSASLPSWPPFPETVAVLRTLRDRGWHLAILSNTDPDLLVSSLAAIGTPFDMTVTASEIGSYKPGFTHWEAFFERTNADRTRHAHVAASLFHDVQPCAALGLPCVWINRLGEASDVPRAGELADLRALPDTLDALVPAS